MKVVITGGAGFLGINLVRYLQKKGINDIVCFDIAPFDYPEKESITRITGDIRDTAMVEKALSGADMVIHTAAALPLYSREDIFSTDVTGTRNLLEQAEKEKIKRFVMISSTAVYGIPDHHPLVETDKLDGVGPYGEAKIAAEQVCLEFRNKGMCVPIIRPKSFIGPERLGVFALLYDWALDGKSFPMIGNGSNRYQFLDVEDLCDSIYLVMTKDPETANDTYNIGAEEFTTMKEDFQAVLDEAGAGKRIVTFPFWPIITALRILEFFRLSPLYKWVYETAYTDSYVSIDKAKEKIGYSPKFSNKDALIRNFTWYKNNLESFRNTSGISHRVPWKQGILRFFKIFF